MTSNSVESGRAGHLSSPASRCPQSVAIAAFGVVLFLCSFAGASAQDPGRIKADVRVGAAHPVGELADFLAGGPSLWIGGRYLLNERFAILVEGARSYFRGMVPEGHPHDDPAHRYETDTRFQRFLIGTEVAIAPFDRHSVGASLRATTGRVSHRVEKRGSIISCGPPARASMLEEAWTAGLGMRLSYELGSAGRVSATADLIGAFQDVDDQFVGPTAWGPCPDEEHFVKGFGFPLTFPITLGLSVGI